MSPKIIKTILVVLFLMIVTIPSGYSAKKESSTKEHSFKLVIPAPSLQNNRLDEAASQPVFIYLPPTYYTSEKRYPAVYFFNGFGDTPDIIGFVKEPLDNLMKKGELQEFILVSVNGINKLGGSFLVNSAVTGNWEDYATKDVVNYIDQNYRTVSDPAARGIVGFSMGGFAAINLGMRHPDIYSAVFALCPGLFDENGLDNAWGTWDLTFLTAYGAAFSPNLDKPAPYADIFDLIGAWEDNELRIKWENGFGNIKGKIADYLTKSNRLKAIRIEYGVNDYYQWIPEGCIYFGKQLAHAKIPHELVELEAGHEWTVDLLINDMFPFFSKNLATQ